MDVLSNLLAAATGDGGSIRGWIALTLAVAIAAGAVGAVGWVVLRGVRGLSRANAGGRRVLIVVAVTVAFAVAGIGGVQSFNAVSDKFGSALVPLVADGMVIACTALRLAALTRGWRIPGALLTTYVFIGGTVALNVDAANGELDKAIAHALAPLAYAVLVEMLAHMLRLHLKLSQPVRAKLSALTWFTSPVITTRVWLHLSRTGTTDPVQARALVQQVVRMSSRLSAVCPSPRLWPFGSARAARSAALQTIRDGLLSAGELAALLPTGRQLAAGELLALVDGAALGIATAQTHPSETVQEEDEDADSAAWLAGFVIGALHQQRADRRAMEQSTHTARVLGFAFGALHQQIIDQRAMEQSTPTAPHQSAPAPVQLKERTGERAPVQPPAAAARAGASVISAPVAESARSGAGARSKRSDESDLAALLEVSRREHGGQPLGQREITRVLGCGFTKARRLADLAGWVPPGVGDNADHDGVNDAGESDADSNHQDDENSTEEIYEFEMSSKS